jgi:hypothetical protein
MATGPIPPDLREELTQKEELYCQLRAQGYTKTKAAMKAYPDQKYPAQAGYEAELRPVVQKRIQALKTERAEVAGLDVDEQLRRYNELYLLALDKGQLETARKMLERIDAIGGFDAPKRSESISIRKGESLKDAEGDISGDITRFSTILGDHTPKDSSEVN